MVKLAQWLLKEHGAAERLGQDRCMWPRGPNIMRKGQRSRYVRSQGRWCWQAQQQWKRETGELAPWCNEALRDDTPGSGPKLNISICVLLGGNEMMSLQWASSVGARLTICNCERVERGRGLSKVGMQGYIPTRSWELKAVCMERKAQCEWGTEKHTSEEEQQPIKDAKAKYGGDKKK